MDQGWRKLFDEVGVSLAWLCRNCCFKSDKALTRCWCLGGDRRFQNMCVHLICDWSAFGFRSDRIVNPLDKGGVVYTATLVGQKPLLSSIPRLIIIISCKIKFNLCLLGLFLSWLSSRFFYQIIKSSLPTPLSSNLCLHHTLFAWFYCSDSVISLPIIF